MTLWYAGVLLLSALIIAGLSIKELRERRDNIEEPDDSLQDVIALVCWIGIPAVILSIGGGWLLMRRALAPITTLTRAAEGINERNLTQLLPRSGNGDELDRLTQVLNTMTARLHESFTRIRDFTLHASHELKTPLTVLSGETEIELQDETLSALARERAGSRLDELHRLARIVDGLTLLAKADAGLVALNVGPVELDELVRENFADTQILAQASGIHVQLTSCEALSTNGDAHRLRQLLLNLADNAVKYNQSQGSITMALQRSNGSALFTIANTGPGIPPANLPRVFDRFFRGEAAHNNDPADGCGLGLSIAQWIVSAHKGEISIESIPTQLTTVTVRLPLLQQ
jgi:signal transduction histidine kinase